MISSTEILWWSLIAILILISTVAIVFAVISYVCSQNSQPHQNITRQDVKVKGDLQVDGDSCLGGNVLIDGLQTVLGKSTLNETLIKSMNLGPVQTIGVAGTFQLTKEYTTYRIDTSGVNIIVLLLPAVSDAPGHEFQISLSPNGAGNTIQIDVFAGDFLNNSNVNPVIIMPTVPGSPEMVLLRNDSLNSWFRV
jgi:hypothetical protein